MGSPIKKPEPPESYSPKKKPEIINLAEQMKAQEAAVQPAASTIREKDRNAVRIIKLPACKMVTNGKTDPFAPNGFAAWCEVLEEQRSDKFYPRDFLWSGKDGFVWGYAAAEIPDDLGEFELVDFPGGLYAVAVSVDADGKNHDKVYNGIQEWVQKSGCFVLDESDERRSLGTISSPPGFEKVLGYAQMELYFPIRMKELGE